jgi:hypothetical protein
MSNDSVGVEPMILRRVEQSRWRFSVLLAFCVVATFFSGCNQRPQVVIEGGSVPLFKVTGRGSIQVITVSGPDFDNPNSRDAGSRYMKPFWQIVAQPGHNIALVEQLGGIVYGKVPDGFKQVFPPNGATPQPLVENELFTFDLRLGNGEAIGNRFVIHNGRVAVEGS